MLGCFLYGVTAQAADIVYSASNVWGHHTFPLVSASPCICIYNVNI